ncbi:VCBS repeat-containing protein [uncultured Rubinisphaera sp.]|uniref:FG-GAP repeat domain-containing protein n=1 Tax=uncultured Rubinisphaera sp. TaxID=1678686 RepID=UPI0030D98E32
MRTIKTLALLCAAAWMYETLPTNAADFEPIPYNNPGLKVDLGVGLWGWPLPMDYDHDGDYDLLVSCPDVPSNGVYFFENTGNDPKLPVFKPGVHLGKGMSNITLSYVNNQPRVLVPGYELTEITSGNVDEKQKIYPTSEVLRNGGKLRARQWSYVDYEGDGDLDLVIGQGHWDDYGWDDAFDEQGNWTRGPLHGFVYLVENKGTTEKPDYQKPQYVQAGGKNVDVYGMPSPNFADFDQDGDLDLLCGDFIDGFTYFQNIGTRQKPVYDSGRELSREGKAIEMPLCMIVVSSLDWDRDGDIDLIVGQEDGRVAFVENTGKVKEGMPQFAEPVFFQQEAKYLKFGALVTPVGFDWDNDGDEDLVCGNTAGEIGWFENLDGSAQPKWNPPKLLEADGEPIVIQAGLNGSIQGPAEQKWGYTTIDVADWDNDGLPDILANSIWGKVVWYRNVGTREKPQLSTAQPVTVNWTSEPPKPAWNWWSPADNELATQWRTTPVVIDWNEDGLNDLVMLDHEGYLAFFEREKIDGNLQLKPGQRVFQGGAFNNRQQPQKANPESPLQLNTGTAGASGRRKLCFVDWNGDGKRDLLINSVNANLMENAGTKNGKTRFVDKGMLGERRLAGHTTSPTTVDWNQDGKRDLVLGAEDGLLYFLPHE